MPVCNVFPACNWQVALFSTVFVKLYTVSVVGLKEPSHLFFDVTSLYQYGVLPNS